MSFTSRNGTQSHILKSLFPIGRMLHRSARKLKAVMDTPNGVVHLSNSLCRDPSSVPSLFCNTWTSREMLSSETNPYLYLNVVERLAIQDQVASPFHRVVDVEILRSQQIFVDIELGYHTIAPSASIADRLPAMSRMLTGTSSLSTPSSSMGTSSFPENILFNSTKVCSYVKPSTSRRLVQRHEDGRIVFRRRTVATDKLPLKSTSISNLR